MQSSSLTIFSIHSFDLCRLAIELAEVILKLEATERDLHESKSVASVATYRLEELIDQMSRLEQTHALQRKELGGVANGPLFVGKPLIFGQPGCVAIRHLFA